MSLNVTVRQLRNIKGLSELRCSMYLLFRVFMETKRSRGYLAQITKDFIIYELYGITVYISNRNN